MRKAVLLLAILAAAPALAQPVRTWVSVDGSDLNDCSRETPCRNFDAAVTAVANGGEVVVLDSGGFGAVVVNKPVTMLAPAGIHAAIAPTSGVAIDIDATTSGPVILQNLYLNAQGASDGIRYASSQPLSITDCVSNGFNLTGFSSTAGATGRLYVINSEFRNNGFHGFEYTALLPGQALIDNTRFDGNELDGLRMLGNARLTIRDSGSFGNGGTGFTFLGGNGHRADLTGCVAAGNGEHGFGVSNVTTGALIVHLEDCVSTENATGVRASANVGASCHVFVAESTVIFNDTGIVGLGGALVRSQGNNTLENNSAGNAFIGPLALSK